MKVSRSHARHQILGEKNMVEVEITERTVNELMHRSEIKFTIEHFGEGSPNRIEVKEKIAAMETADPELTFIRTMKGEFGLPKLVGEVYIYDSEEFAKEIEPRYSKVRNVPKDKRSDLLKELKGEA